ncbi:unnamed protein product [Dovyalis caffra]|uniref:TraB domain-containing protein n=1 Tax=Dovyalis caffra TaxID=77055 RepID=A0AAV1RHF3_9ROSI|nr:unnamed protein product [Dovyalis caffra]
MKTRVLMRLTRLLLSQLSSTQSHRFFSTTTTTLSPLRHHQTTVIFTRSIYSPPKSRQIRTFATTSESIADAVNELREDDNKNDVASKGKELPHDFYRNIVALTCESKAEGGKCVVYLVGTAHVSKESCWEVQAVIRHVKPQVVFLELCASRVALLTARTLKIPTIKEMIDKWKKTHDSLGIFLGWWYAKIGDMLGIVPGSEFRVALEEARKCDAKVVLGDRPVQLKDLDDAGTLTRAIQRISEQYPSVMETLVHERDQYMSSILLRIAKEHTSVIAVVGKGHLQGIQKYWEQPVETYMLTSSSFPLLQLKDLLTLPPQKPSFPALKVLAAAVAIVENDLLELPPQKSALSAPKVLAIAGVAIGLCIYLSCKE